MCLVMVLVYTVGAKMSIRTPPSAQTGSTLSSMKRHRAGTTTEADWLRNGGIAAIKTR